MKVSKFFALVCLIHLLGYPSRSNPSFDGVVNDTSRGAVADSMNGNAQLPDSEINSFKLSLDENYYALDPKLIHLAPTQLTDEDLKPIDQPPDFGQGGVVEKAEAWQKIMGMFSELPLLISSSCQVVNKILDSNSFITLSSELGIAINEDILKSSPLYSSLQIQSFSMIQKMKLNFRSLRRDLMASPNSAEEIGRAHV